MEYFYYDSDNCICIKEKYRQKSYGLNEINLNLVSNIDNLIKEIQEIYQDNIKNKSAFIYPLHPVMVYGLFHGKEIFFHNIGKHDIIGQLIKIGFKIDLESIDAKNSFKKSRNYKTLSDEIKLMLELE